MLSLKSVVRSSPLLMRAVVPLYKVYQEIISEIPKKGVIPSFVGEANISMYRFRSKREYDASEFCGQASTRKAREAEIEKKGSMFHQTGYCAICGAETKFLYSKDFSADNRINWRETGFCQRCGLSSRMRAALHCWIQTYNPRSGDNIYITEKFTPSYRWLKGRFKNLVGSEYLNPELPGGSMVRKVRHEDLQNLSFHNESIDCLLSFEVLEHVPHLELATAEMARILRPGGRLFFSAPFRIDSEATITRAELDKNGNINHILPVEMHGNPADPINGALCYRHFGWDYLETLKNAGFIDPEVITFWSDQLGYMARPAFISAVKH